MVKDDSPRMTWQGVTPDSLEARWIPRTCRGHSDNEETRQARQGQSTFWPAGWPVSLQAGPCSPPLPLHWGCGVLKTRGGEGLCWGPCHVVGLGQTMKGGESSQTLPGDSMCTREPGGTALLEQTVPVGDQ